MISSLIKVSTGLKSVDPSSYLEQTEEILERRQEGSAGLTHPELHIRAKSVDLLSGEFPDLKALTELVRGPLDAKRLDLTGQHNLSGIVRRLVDCRAGARDFMRGEYAANLARRYFEDYEMPDAGPEAGLGQACSEDRAIREVLPRGVRLCAAGLRHRRSRWRRFCADLDAGCGGQAWPVRRLRTRSSAKS